jgi:branched-chain amino acid transport system permease protein
LFKGTFSLKSLILLGAVFFVLLILPPIIPRFYTYILAVIFVTALVAMSLNMVVGHGGLFQFHHGAFYGVGAYTVALMLTKTSLPPWVCFVAGPVAAALVGLLIGGDDGMHGIPIPSIISSSKGAYYFALIVMAICIMVIYLIFKSPFGATLQAIRDNPDRCEAIGVNVKRHQLIAIVIATFFAGIAGVLFVVVEGSVFPDLLFWVFSLEIFIMCLLGGWFTFAGPILGAVIMVSLRTFVGIYTEYWTLILGIILILLIFFLPEGVWGYVLEKLGSRPKEAIEKGSK